MAPSKIYMLNRALRELDGVLSNKAMSMGAVRSAVNIAVDEIRNVLGVLKSEAKSK